MYVKHFKEVEMSKFTRRDFLLSTGLLGIGALLAACAPKATPTPEAPKAPTQPPAAAQPTAVPATPPPAAAQPTAVPATPPPKPAAEKIKVEWMNWWGGAREQLMLEVIRRFEAEFPNIHVENQLQPWDAREQRAATAIASGTPPGLIMVTRAEAQKFAYEKLIIP
ncbi:MAG: twin-arginine translocation signal domain-containing protein, partial [Firmicutes bacterium]|nr:twin-arginine translocation signal domain-containing protein [Bacillota bacterium]MBC7104462.1 twin-arginine translocation signal domain-containing protein [Bacillota bacterium]